MRPVALLSACTTCALHGFRLQPLSTNQQDLENQYDSKLEGNSREEHATSQGAGGSLLTPVLKVLGGEPVLVDQILQLRGGSVPLQPGSQVAHKRASLPLPLCFGLELELVHTITREEAAKLLNDHGIECEAAAWEKPRPYNKWWITEDDSIKPQGFEVISPVLHGHTGLDEARRVASLLLESGACVNNSTGFHVHLDASEWSTGRSMTLKELKKIIAAFITSEEVFDLFMPEDRRASNNCYCKTNVFQKPARACVPHISIQKSLQELINLVCPCSASKDADDVDSGRYHKLNLNNLLGCQTPIMGHLKRKLVSVKARGGPKIRCANCHLWESKMTHEKRTLEFRLHCGTCNPAEIVNWVKLLQIFVELSKSHRCASFGNRPLNSFDELFGALHKLRKAWRKPVEQLHLHYKKRGALFSVGAEQLSIENTNQTRWEWSEYLNWIQGFAYVSCKLSNGNWYNQAAILDVDASGKQKHAPVRVEVPGVDGPIEEWVGLDCLDLCNLHDLSPDSKHESATDISANHDLSCLQPGMKVWALRHDGVWCVAEVVEITSSTRCSKSAIRVRFGDKATEWLGSECLRTLPLACLKQLNVGMRVHALGKDGVWHAAEVVSVSASMVRVDILGRTNRAARGKWVLVDAIRSKALKGCRQLYQ